MRDRWQICCVLSMEFEIRTLVFNTSLIFCGILEIISLQLNEIVNLF